MRVEFVQSQCDNLYNLCRLRPNLSRLLQMCSSVCGLSRISVPFAYTLDHALHCSLGGRSRHQTFHTHVEKVCHESENSIKTMAQAWDLNKNTRATDMCRNSRQHQSYVEVPHRNILMAILAHHCHIHIL